MFRWMCVASLLVGCGDCGGDGSGSGERDGSLVDAERPTEDGGASPLAVHIEPIVGVSGGLPTVIRYLALAEGRELVHGQGTEMLVPGETRDHGPHGDFLGRREEGGAFRWLRVDVSAFGGDHFTESSWLYFDGPFTDSAEYAVEEVPIEAPTLVRWGTDGSLDRFSVPERVSLRVVPGSGTSLVYSEDYAARFDAWQPLGSARLVVGEAPAGTNLAGVLLDGPGEEVPLVAALSAEGLTEVRALGSQIRIGTDGGLHRVGDAAVLPGGDLVLSVTELVEGEGRIFDQALVASQALVRVDPASSRVVRQWPLDTTARTWVVGRFTDPVLEVSVLLSEGRNTVTLGDQSHEADGVTDWISFRWDGSGPVPAGRRRAPAFYLTDEPWVAGDFTGRDPSMLLRRYDESSGAQVLTVRTSGYLRFVTRWEGRVWAAIEPSPDTLQARLVCEGAEPFDIALEPVAAGNRTLWAIELSPETGAVLRQQAIDLGPPAATTEDEEPPILVRPLTADHFLVGRGSYDTPQATLAVHSMDGGRSTEVVARLKGRALMAEETCERLFFERQSTLGTRSAPVHYQPSILGLDGLCVGGPNELTFGEATFDFSEPNVEAVFRLVPE